MADGVNKIGEAYVEIRADADKFAADAKKAEVAAAKAGKKVGKAFEGAGDKIDRSSAGVRKFSGALSGTVGVATAAAGIIGSLVAIFKELNAQMRDGAALADDLFGNIGPASSDAAQKLEEAKNRLIEVSAELARIEEKPFLSQITGRRHKQIREEYAALQKRIEQYNRALRQQRKEQERKAAADEKEARAIKARNDQFATSIRVARELAALEDDSESGVRDAERLRVAALEIEYGEKLRDLRERAAKASGEELRNLRAMMEMERELFLTRRENERELADDRIRAIEQEARIREEQRKKDRELLDDQIAAAQTFRDESATSIGALLNELRHTNRVIQTSGSTGGTGASFGI